MQTRNKKLLLAVSLASTISLYFAYKKLQHKKHKPAAHNSSLTNSTIQVNSKFFKQLSYLLPICVPSLRCKESLLVACLAGTLVSRTMLDIWFSSVNSRVIHSIVSQNKQAFTYNALVLFGLMMWPMSAVNNSIKWLISTLSLRVRGRLTQHAHHLYMQGMTFYTVNNLDRRIPTPDQLLVQDVERFADTLAHLLTDLTKPVVDIVLFGHKLAQSIDAKTPLMMLGYFSLSGALLRLISPSFGALTAEEQRLEGTYRYAHSRIITHSEEIAFYRGAGREKQILNDAFHQLVCHLQRTFRLRFLNGIFDSILVKYCATQLAYILLSKLAFQNKAPKSATQLMELYSRNSSYLINMSQAVGRLVLAGRALTKFAGFTNRVCELFNVLQDVNSHQRSPSSNTSIVTSQKPEIVLEGVPIVTPKNDILIKPMHLRIEKGMHVLITGPNGCGKSSLFRVLGELWPLTEGTLTKPPQQSMFYVPQRPYIPIGTLRDLIIYPNSQVNATKDDSILRYLLQRVRLTYLLERTGESGFDCIQDWNDMLSGGEKQRIAMARLFYHSPVFAILDECTSAVSIDVEGEMYEFARDTLGITLLTISHRPSLFHFHNYLLRFDGEGGYSFEKMPVSAK